MISNRIEIVDSAETGYAAKHNLMTVQVAVGNVPNFNVQSNPNAALPEALPLGTRCVECTGNGALVVRLQLVFETLNPSPETAHVFAEKFEPGGLRIPHHLHDSLVSSRSVLVYVLIDADANGSQSSLDRIDFAQMVGDVVSAPNSVFSIV